MTEICSATTGDESVDDLPTSPRSTSRLIGAGASTVLVASCSAAPVLAEPAPGTVCDPNPATNPSYNATWCATWTEPAKATGDGWFAWPDLSWQLPVGAAMIALGVWILCSGGDAQPDGLSAHRDNRGPAAGALRAESARIRALAGLVVAAGALVIAGGLSAGWMVVGVVAAVLIGWATVSRYQRLSVVKAGYELADRRWIDAAEAAERNGEPAPAEPTMNREQAHALGLTEGHVAPPGSAAEVMLDIAGRDGPTRAAWLRVAEALAMGSRDDAGGFTPWATIDRVETADTGDVTVAWDLADISKTAGSMKPAGGPLCRELRVREIVGGGWTTDHVSGQVFARFTNGGSPTTAADPAPSTSDDWDF